MGAAMRVLLGLHGVPLGEPHGSRGGAPCRVDAPPVHGDPNYGSPWLTGVHGSHLHGSPYGSPWESRPMGPHVSHPMISMGPMGSPWCSFPPLRIFPLRGLPVRVPNFPRRRGGSAPPPRTPPKGRLPGGSRPFGGVLGGGAPPPAREIWHVRAYYTSTYFPCSGPRSSPHCMLRQLGADGELHRSIKCVCAHVGSHAPQRRPVLRFS